MPAFTQNLIECELADVESNQNIRILYAAAVGSQAFGFSSPVSDADVRFIFVRPLSDYISITPPRDDIERKLGDGLDLTGWDLRKCLGLASVSNISIWELLMSPLVYRKSVPFIDEFRSLATATYNPDRSKYHYASIVKEHLRKYLSKETVYQKRYLHALRAALSYEWISKHASPPLIDFESLVQETVYDNVLFSQIMTLVSRKKAGQLPVSAPLSIIHDFLASKLAAYPSGSHQATLTTEHIDAMNSFFGRSVSDVA